MKKKTKLQNLINIRRKKRVRAKIFGTATRPRLSVFRSIGHVYAQLIDDEKGKTLASVRDQEAKAGKTKTEQAQAAGKLLAEKAKKAGISEAVFDKGQNKYHGRIKALAEGAREGGLKI